MSSLCYEDSFKKLFSFTYWPTDAITKVGSINMCDKVHMNYTELVQQLEMFGLKLELSK
jgi:hypothetical protein